MAHGKSGTKAVEDEGMKQLNVLIPQERLETLHQLKAVCNVPLTGLVKACIDLFSLAHGKAQGGLVILGTPDGKEQIEVRLPLGELVAGPTKTRQVGEIEGEEPAQP